MMRQWVGKNSWIWIVMCVWTCSCARHFYDVAWQGIVVDAKTGLPIPYCEIQTSCLYQNNMDRSGKKTYQTQTDLFGNFSFHIEKGYQINSQLSAHGYEPVDFTASLLPGNLPRVIKLNKLAGADNSQLEVRVLSESISEKNAPFIGVKYILVDSLRVEFADMIGFDLLNGKQAHHVDSVDVWIEFSRDVQRNPIVWANRKGGLFPLVASLDSVAGHLLNCDYAPVDGYRASCQLTGLENGFFVKCRDGIHYAKLIMDNYLCVIQYGEEKERVKELGVRFSYVVQRDPSQPRFFPERLISELTAPNRQPPLHSQSDVE